MEGFNPQIEETQLPLLESLQFRGLENDYFKVMIWATAIRLSIYFVILGIAYFVFPFDIPDLLWLIIWIWFFLFVIWRIISTIKGFQKKGYALRDKDLVYKSGWLWQTMITTPFNRVQHISIEQGPIERQFSLSRLKVFTAGGSGSDLTIPGLRPQTAEKLKEFVVRKAQIDEEE